MNETTPYSIPKEPGRWRAIMLAALVHALLFGFFWIGIRWQNQHAVPVEAEVWDMQTKQAAPRPQPEPEVRPEPKPVVKETPPPKPVEEAPVARKPDIALEQEKKRKELEKKKLAEEAAARQKQLAEEKRLEKEREKERQKELEKKKLAAAEQLKKDEAAKKQKEAADKKRKEEADKKRQKEEAESKMLAQWREQDQARIKSGTGGMGDAPKSQGNNKGDPAYVDRISAKIKSNIIFNVPNDLSGNPPVEFEVRLLPDGSIAGVRKIKSSGVPGFDEAVARAIERSQPFPKDKSGTVPGYFNGIHRPKDQ